MEIIFETERLLLRKIEPTDAQDFFELDSDPDVVRYVGNRPQKDISEAEHLISVVLQQYVDNGFTRVVMIEKSTGKFIGWSGLKIEKNIRKEFEYYDLGYRLKKAFWGKGYATESAIGSLKYGFEELNLDVINACADVDNQPSNKILKKVGMEFIEQFDYSGIVHNWYGITKSDWASTQKK